MTDASDPLESLRAARTSDGAPSARNLIVTVFGDCLLPYGDDTEISVRSLAELLSSFGVNDRLVRTSLTRLVNEDLLASRTEGRNSYYRVAPGALHLFRDADRRIYEGGAPEWDGSWTVVVVDASESTADHRARLRQELAWAGLGVVAPNVMASPIVPARAAAEVVAHVGGFSNVLVSRSEVVEAEGTLDADELARRCSPVDELADRYATFVERFSPFTAEVVGALDEADALKLRILLVATFRRIAVSDPPVPDALLPDDWIGDHARGLAARIYAGCAELADRPLRAAISGASPAPLPAGWLAARFATDADAGGR